MYKIGWWLSRMTTALTVVGGLAIALMMLHVTLDVVMRSFFNSPLPGTITVVSHYYMIIAAFLPLAFTEQKNSHISVEVFADLLGHHGRRHLTGWTLPLSGLVFVAMALQSWHEANAKQGIEASVVQGNTSIPIWPTYYVLPVSFVLLSVVVAYKFLVYLMGQRSGLDADRIQSRDSVSDPGAGDE
ncbi:MAG TPA: TRAP transporter small permease [Alcanivorax sp.]|nr:C4-dicarboxylate ABC transporter substrate-binding protein [Halomonas sp.]HBP70058.1 TRAP transporter small permease [Alcanivorax sp.]|tara:strand:+ start:252 stop:809 length:558 start_codon:yes stop_codon:yes gene_type:complete